MTHVSEDEHVKVIRSIFTGSSTHNSSSRGELSNFDFESLSLQSFFEST